MEFPGLFFFKSLAVFENVRQEEGVRCLIYTLLSFFFFLIIGIHSSLGWCPLVEHNPEYWDLKVDNSVLACPYP